MQLSSFLKIFLPLPAVILFAVSSCVKPDETAIDRDPTVSIPLGTVGTKASSQFVTVDADGSWIISLDFGEAETWASIGPAAGGGRRRYFLKGRKRLFYAKDSRGISVENLIDIFL